MNCEYTNTKNKKDEPICIVDKLRSTVDEIGGGTAISSFLIGSGIVGWIYEVSDKTERISDYIPVFAVSLGVGLFGYFNSGIRIKKKINNILRNYKNSPSYNPQLTNDDTKESIDKIM